MLSEYGRDAKILIGANALGQTFLWFSFFIMPFYLKALGYDMKAMGAFFSAQTIVGGIFFLLAGHVSLRLGYRKTLLLSALIGLGAGITIPFMSLYFKLRFGETLQAISWIFFFQQLAMGLGSFELPELVRRWGPVKVITSFQGLATFLFAVFPSIETFALAGAVYVLRAILMNIIWPINDSFMMGFFRTEEKATANGIRQAFSTFMRGVGNSLGGTLFAVSLAYPFYATALLYATATGLFYAFFIKHNEE